MKKKEGFLRWYWKNKVNTEISKELLGVFLIAGGWMLLCGVIGYLISGDRGLAFGIISSMIPTLFTFLFIIIPYQEYKDKNYGDGRRQRE